MSAVPKDKLCTILPSIRSASSRRKITALELFGNPLCPHPPSTHALLEPGLPALFLSPLCHLTPVRETRCFCSSSHEQQRLRDRSSGRSEAQSTCTSPHSANRPAFVLRPPQCADPTSLPSASLIPVSETPSFLPPC
ncbi:hypothetical protein P280DRAFT_244861 [Massarina eburnea CBS 473.64]|uniref:Uncharacterized protein n=1 Tax=Massarina eburnea CBS 473.64 TaxID=1395130 RepID=A0A6A6S819_9PLEO|nr:hypothetical protein P280DRAFT_244861 [Massarina eburnea CBS 473.64]